MKIHFFNPENDLALASGDAHYTPPASALLMATELESLPSLWACDGDVVLRRSMPNAKALAERIVAAESVGEDVEVCPWGWSALAREQLLSLGVPERLLPSNSWMAVHRTMASRRTAVRLLGDLLADASSPENTLHNLPLIGESCWCRTEGEVTSCHARWGEMMMKMPWSGSGRGNYPVHGRTVDSRMGAWVRKVLRTQGGVVVEPLYINNVCDLAFEFTSDGHGSVVFLGLSVFRTTPGGVYAGNWVVAERHKREYLSRWLKDSCLHAVRLWLEKWLSKTVGNIYHGPLGVDMMIVNCNGQAFLHPCVEVNLRHTMGWVACQLAVNLPEDASKWFRISYTNGHYKTELL